MVGAQNFGGRRVKMMVEDDLGVMADEDEEETKMGGLKVLSG